MTAGTPRWLMLAFVACCIYSAAAIATSWINTAHNSDTVLQAFISIERWTPYYWEENRFGMLLPALAAPIRAWGWNLLFQIFLVAGSGIGCLFLAARLTGSTREAECATPMIFAVVLLIFRPGAALVLLLGSTYLPPLFLALTALRVWTGQGIGRLPLRFAGFLFLLLLSLWINTANVIVVAIALALWPGLSLRRRALGLAGIALTAISLQAFASQYPGADFQKLLPPEQWFASAALLTTDAARRSIYPTAWLATLVAGLFMPLLILRKLAWRPAGALIAGALVQCVAAADSQWVAMNGHDARYILSALFLISSLALAEIFVPLVSGLYKLLGPEPTLATASLVMLAVSTQGFGVPSSERALRYMEQASRPSAAAFDNVRCTHLAGDYWRVWMALFHDALTDRQPRRWPLTFRGLPMKPAWDAMPESDRSYCALCSDTSLDLMRQYEKSPPFVMSGRSGDICLYRTEQAR